MCEKAEVASNRLDIVDLEAKNEAVNHSQDLDTWEAYMSETGDVKAVKGMKNPEDITGGYLIELIRESGYQEVRSGFVTDDGNFYCIVSPENASIEQVEYLKGLFNEMETAMKQADGIHPTTGKHFSEYLDMDSWTSKYVLEEAFHNPEGAMRSCFFYKDSDSVNPLIKAGPLWDYDRSMGGYERGVTLDNPKQIGNYIKYADYLMQYDEVKKAVAEKLETEMLPYVEEKLVAYVDEQALMLEASAEMDSVRWPENQGYYVERDSHLEYMKLFLQEKTTFLKEIWLEDKLYHTVKFLGYDGEVYREYMVEHGDHLTEAPTCTSYGAIFNGWKSLETGQSYSSQFPVLEDITYESEWLDVTLLVENAISITEVDVEQVDLEALKAFVDEIEKLREEE